MIRRARDFRLVPIVVCAATSLLVLKSIGLLLDGGYTLGQPRAALAEVATDNVPPEAVPDETTQSTKGDLRPVRSADATRADGPRVDTPPADAPKPAGPRQKSWAQEMFGYPDYTGSTAAPKKTEPGPEAAPKGEAGKTAQVAPKPAEPPLTHESERPMISAGERAVLESLNQRRLEIEARARALDVRESLLAAAEKRIEGRLGELKELEARINATLQKKDEAEAARFKGLVTMYENMKAKDAAKIFDRLDMRILVEVATQINPRRMSDILGLMTPEAAERLTIAIANRSDGPEKARPSPELPKIEGRPSGT
jgi:flagellar motility protein MotE (MotC chaperone)